MARRLLPRRAAVEVSAEAGGVAKGGEVAPLRLETSLLAVLATSKCAEIAEVAVTLAGVRRARLTCATAVIENLLNVYLWVI